MICPMKYFRKFGICSDENVRDPNCLIACITTKERKLLRKESFYRVTDYGELNKVIQSDVSNLRRRMILEQCYTFYESRRCHNFYDKPITGIMLDDRGTKVG